MKTAVEHLKDTHKAICESIERKRERILDMEKMLQNERNTLTERIDEAAAIYKAIEVLNDSE